MTVDKAELNPKQLGYKQTHVVSTQVLQRVYGRQNRLSKIQVIVGCGYPYKGKELTYALSIQTHARSLTTAVTDWTPGSEKVGEIWVNSPSSACKVTERPRSD